jgi:hypothetical protein
MVWKVWRKMSTSSGRNEIVNRVHDKGMVVGVFFSNPGRLFF